MTKTQQKRFIWGLLIVVVSALFTVLISLALKQNLQLYYTPSDISQGLAPQHHSIRMGGMVVPGSVHREDQSMKVAFTLTDGAASVVVQYEGILPDLFKE